MHFSSPLDIYHQHMYYCELLDSTIQPLTGEKTQKATLCVNIQTHRFHCVLLTLILCP